MTFNINNFDKFLESFTTENQSMRIMSDLERDGYRISLVVNEYVSRMDTLRQGPDSMVHAMEKLRDKVIAGKLFYHERQQLEEYKKLKDMKFVLEAISKLDLSAIAKTDSKKDTFLSENNQINTYLGRK